MTLYKAQYHIYNAYINFITLLFFCVENMVFIGQVICITQSLLSNNSHLV
jgi:hypothetical protein